MHPASRLDASPCRCSRQCNCSRHGYISPLMVSPLHRLPLEIHVLSRTLVVSNRDSAKSQWHQTPVAWLPVRRVPSGPRSSKVKITAIQARTMTMCQQVNREAVRPGAESILAPSASTAAISNCQSLSLPPHRPPPADAMMGTRWSSVPTSSL